LFGDLGFGLGHPGDHRGCPAVTDRQGGDQPIWFSVEDDDGRLKLAMWVSRKELQLEPGGQHVVDDVT
jgi:hypothetical protein